MYRYVIFDLDGTLLNTLDDLADAGNWVCRNHGWPEHSLEEYKYFVGNGMAKLVERVLPEFARSEGQIQKILEEDMSFYRKILNSSASAIMQEQLVAVVTEFMLEHKDQFYPGSQEGYKIAIRFCAGGLSNLYRDWFSGKLPYTLEELTQIGEILIQRIIGK